MKCIFNTIWIPKLQQALGDIVSRFKNDHCCIKDLHDWVIGCEPELLAKAEAGLIINALATKPLRWCERTPESDSDSDVEFPGNIHRDLSLSILSHLRSVGFKGRPSIESVACVLEHMEIIQNWEGWSMDGTHAVLSYGDTFLGHMVKFGAEVEGWGEKDWERLEKVTRGILYTNDYIGAPPYGMHVAWAIDDILHHCDSAQRLAAARAGVADVSMDLCCAIHGLEAVLHAECEMQVVALSKAAGVAAGAAAGAAAESTLELKKTLERERLAHADELVRMQTRLAQLENRLKTASSETAAVGGDERCRKSARISAAGRGDMGAGGGSSGQARPSRAAAEGRQTGPATEDKRHSLRMKFAELKVKEDRVRQRACVVTGFLCYHFSL